jgi:hypothetical protein
MVTVNLKCVKEKKMICVDFLKIINAGLAYLFFGGLDVANFYTESLDLKEDCRGGFKGAQESQTQTLY